MGKRPNGRYKNTKGRFVMLYLEMLESDAWKDLSHVSRTLYPLLAIQKRNSDPNEVIKLPYRDPLVNGVLSTTGMSKGIKELISHGFIERVEIGGLGGGIVQLKRDNSLKERRLTSKYKLSDKWRYWDINKPFPIV